MSDNIDITIRPPHMVVEVQLPGHDSLSCELEYDLVDIIDFSGDGDIDIIDSHWHGIVLEDGDGETHHVDLRDLPLADES